jgi:hypothetical protein
MNFHTIVLVAGLLTVALTLVSLRRQHIRSEYSVSWLSVGVALICLAAFPTLLDGFASRLGLATETCFLMAGGALMSALVFEISHMVSRLRDDNVMLAQRIAILEHQLQEFSSQNDRRDS